MNKNSKALKLGDVEAKKSAVIIDFLETLAPNGVFSMLSSEDRTSIITLQRWARDINIMQSGNPVILITQNLSEQKKKCFVKPAYQK